MNLGVPKSYIECEIHGKEAPYITFDFRGERGEVKLSRTYCASCMTELMDKYLKDHEVKTEND